jgi:methylase of polypeptide subunit release factors
MFYLLYGRKLHFAPIEDPHRILDVGTGTGIWAIDMADQYLMAEVIGVDLRYVGRFPILRIL